LDEGNKVSLAGCWKSPIRIWTLKKELSLRRNFKVNTKNPNLNLFSY